MIEYKVDGERTSSLEDAIELAIDVVGGKHFDDEVIVQTKEVGESFFEPWLGVSRTDTEVNIVGRFPHPLDGDREVPTDGFFRVRHFTGRTSLEEVFETARRLLSGSTPHYSLTVEQYGRGGFEFWGEVYKTGPGSFRLKLEV